MTDSRAILIGLAILGAPIALVLLAAIVRGYSISLSMRRDRQRRRDDD